MRLSTIPICLFLIFSLYQVQASATKKVYTIYTSLNFKFCNTNLHSVLAKKKKTYIVYLGSHSHGKDVSDEVLDRVTKSHYEFLASFLGSHENAKKDMVYSYQRHINGFAANLEEEDAAKIANHPEVISVFLNQWKKLHTTRSWDFMMLEKDGLIHQDSLWKKARFGEDVIIGTLDSGVWPESLSFSDEDYDPIPSRWRGTCQNGPVTAVSCNRKLIGARYFSKGFEQITGKKLDPSQQTPRDYEGHGTHTLSTAGGNFVAGASFFGLANGTAKGGSPRARVAAYKVCFPPYGRCSQVDILAAFDMAIHDGVDVLSLSIGGDPVDYFYDSTAIGAFHAVMNGITVVCSAGNDGPAPQTVTNLAPWIMTVAASTLDREFQAFVGIGNGGRLFEGKSLSQGLPNDTFYPLITGEQAKAANASAYDALLCKAGTLDPKKAKGKILACLRGETYLLDKGREVALAGAVGMILCNDKEKGNNFFAEAHVIPTVHLSYADGAALIAYIYSTKNPVGYITIPSAKLQAKPAPVVAYFSSQGPNWVTPEILKPDITAPGVDILASFSEAVSPTGMDYDKRKVAFSIMSGTSMSCPHVSGVAGLLKALHPDWSPAAIRSAIMTTARTRDNRGKPMLNGKDFLKATPFHYGAGHMRPNRAMDPGLIYDLNTNDYLNFLCASGYNNTLVQSFSDDPYQCPESVNLLDFNYPSITIPNVVGSVSVTRRVRNVGSSSTYVARVHEPTGFSVSVDPSVLTFEKTGTEKSFVVTVTAVNPPNATWDSFFPAYAFGGLTWSDGFHYVRSPIVVAGSRIN